MLYWACKNCESELKYLALQPVKHPNLKLCWFKCIAMSKWSKFIRKSEKEDWDNYNYCIQYFDRTRRNVLNVVWTSKQRYVRTAHLNTTQEPTFSTKKVINGFYWRQIGQENRLVIFDNFLLFKILTKIRLKPYLTNETLDKKLVKKICWRKLLPTSITYTTNFSYTTIYQNILLYHFFNPIPMYITIDPCNPN